MAPRRSLPPLRALAIALLAAVPLLHAGEARAQGESGALLVTVTSGQSGRPVMGARVSVVGTTLAATTDASGRLRMVGLPAGTQTVEVRRLGYASRLGLVKVQPGEAVSAAFTLDVEAIPVAAIEVKAEARRDFGAEYLERAGFDRRRRTGFGAFITRAELEKQNPSYLSDALRRVSGVRLAPRSQRGDSYATMARSGARNCPIQYYVDGATIGPGFNIDEIHARDVQGLEIYRGGSQVPPEFNRRTAGCGVIVIWTRPR